MAAQGSPHLFKAVPRTPRPLGSVSARASFKRLPTSAARVLRVIALALLLAPLASAQQAAEPAAMIHIFDGHFLDATPNGTIVPAGATIAVMSFANSDHSAKPHSLTSDDGTSFDLAIPAPDNPDGYVYLNFTAALAPGSYPYHSRMAGDDAMHGIIIVQGTPIAPKQSPGPTLALLGLALLATLAVKRSG